jgi:hypothetical protein
MTSESKGDDEGTPAHGSSSGTCTHLESNRVKLKKWAAVALWSYDIGGSRKRIIFSSFFLHTGPTCVCVQNLSSGFSLFFAGNAENCAICLNTLSDRCESYVVIPFSRRSKEQMMSDGVRFCCLVRH